MNQGYTAPKIFISYCWTPAQNAERTHQLAERLRDNGIDVIIDIWDLDEGQDIHLFMERCVNDKDVKKVLLICNEDYTHKSNTKKGGVGKESSIISNELFDKAEQTKFIPIVFQKDSNGIPFVPTFCKSLKYFDLSNDENYELEFEKIVRNIFNKPFHKKPPLGAAPFYIYEKESVPSIQYLCSNPLSQIKLKKQKGLDINTELIQSFKEAYLIDLEKINIPYNEYPSVNDPTEFFNFTFNKLDENIFLRDSFVEFINNSISSIDFNITLLQFIEDIHQKMIDLSNSNRSSYSIHHEIYKIFQYELFLYISAFLYKKNKIKELSYILHNNIFYTDNHNNEYISYINFNPRIDLFRDDQNRFRFIRNRGNNIHVNYNDLAEIDLLLYYISIFRKDKIGTNNNSNWYWWNPFLNFNNSLIYPFYKRLKSKRYFNQVKPLFNVENEKELKNKIEVSKSDEIDTLRNWGWRNFKIEKTFDVENLCTIE